MLSSAFLAFLLLQPALAQAQQPDAKLAELTAKFEQRLRELASSLDGVAGVGLKDLASGYEFYLNGDELFPQASVIKIPILLKLFEDAQAGRLRLEERVTVRAADFAPGSGVLRELGDGSVTLSLHDLAVLMIVLSDNTATNLLIERVGGLAGVNQMLARRGFTHTRLNRKMGVWRGPEGQKDSTSSPSEMVRLLEQVERGPAGSGLDAAHTRRVLAILAKDKDSNLREALPPGTRVANKTGSLPGVRCDSAIVYLKAPDGADRPYVLTISTTYLRNDADGGRFIAEVARLAYDYFARLAASTPLGRRLP